MKIKLPLLTALLLANAIFCIGQEDWDTLLFDGFDNGSSENWALDTGWVISHSEDNYYLKGTKWSEARYNKGVLWTDYSLKTNFRINTGTFSVFFRYDNRISNKLYSLNINPGGIYLDKTIDHENWYLASEGFSIDENQWHSLEIIVNGKTIQVYLNNILRIQHFDSDALTNGTFAFAAYDHPDIDFDNILVIGKDAFEAPQGYDWYRTGGPVGGLGYDIRIHPLDKDIMFVTDNPSGVNKSIDGGQTWIQKNSGIHVNTTNPNFVTPIFSLTIDPSNPEIIWSGTQNTRGIFRSDDTGESWVRKDNGILEGSDISFRGFAVHPKNSRHNIGSS